MEKNTVKFEELKKAINDRNRQLKKEARKQKVEEKKRKVSKWFNENKELVIILAPIVVGATVRLGFGIGKTIRSSIKSNQELRVKETKYYDRSLGHYWTLKRPLTNDELSYIGRQKEAGRKLADILAELRVLK